MQKVYLSLKDWRTQDGRTVQELAAHVGVSRVTWHDWERGGSVPRRDAMAKLVELTEGRVQPASFYPQGQAA